MKLLKQKGPTCMIVSTAMLFDCTVEEVMGFLGHSAGVHIQEIQRFALARGYGLVLYEPRPVLEGEELAPWAGRAPWLVLEGLMLGKNTNGNNHCVAWDGEKIYDPAIVSRFAGYSQFWAKVEIVSFKTIIHPYSSL